jgi:hypothetical protein
VPGRARLSPLTTTPSPSEPLGGSAWRRASALRADDRKALNRRARNRSRRGSSAAFHFPTTGCNPPTVFPVAISGKIRRRGDQISHDFSRFIASFTRQFAGYADDILVLPQALKKTDIDMLYRQGAERYLAGVALAKMRQFST